MMSISKSPDCGSQDSRGEAQATTGSKVLNHFSIFLILLIAQIIAFQLHEIGHWLIGKAIGLNVIFQYSHVDPGSESISATKTFLFALGGPMVTYGLAISLLLFARAKGRQRELLLFGLPNCFLRARAMFKCLRQNELFQDECQMAQVLGLPPLSLAWASFLLSLVLLTWFMASLERDRGPIFFYGLVASFVGPGLVFLVKPFLP